MAELGIAEELDKHVDGSALWRAEPITGNCTGEATLELGPGIIAVFGATSVDDDLELFVERHGKTALAPTIAETVKFLEGKRTRRGVADELGVPAVEGIAVTQEIERIIVLLKDHDPTLSDITIDIDVPDLAVERGPYQRE